MGAHAMMKERIEVTGPVDVNDVGGAAQSEWRRPVLRKLPIAATAGSKTGGNEGSGQGKGDASQIS